MGQMIRYHGVREKADGDEAEDCFGKVVKGEASEAASAKGLINRF